MTSFTSRYGDPAVDYRGAHMWAHVRHTAKVVDVAGRVDAANVDGVIDFVLQSVAADAPFVLDLGAVSTFTPAAVRLLNAVENHCAQSGGKWALVASDAVTRRLRVGIGNGVRYPFFNSTVGAEHHFDDDILARRRGVWPLLSHTA